MVGNGENIFTVNINILSMHHMPLCNTPCRQVADAFRCRQCDGTIQEVDLAEDLMVDGETYECVELLLYGRHS